MSLNKFVDINVKKDWMNLNCAGIVCDTLALENYNVGTYQFSNTQTLVIPINGAGTYNVIDFSNDTPSNNVQLNLKNNSQYAFECSFLKGAGNVVLSQPLLFNLYIAGTQTSNIGGFSSIAGNTIIVFKIKIAVVSGSGTVNGVLKTISEIIYTNSSGVRQEIIAYELTNNVDLSGETPLNFTLSTNASNVYSLSRLLASIQCVFQAESL